MIWCHFIGKLECEVISHLRVTYIICGDWGSRGKYGIYNLLHKIMFKKCDNYERLFFLGMCVALKRAVYSVKLELK